MNNLAWFDGHLDLAYLAQQGAYLRLPPDQAGGNFAPVAVTFPSLRAGNVKAALATIFVQRQITAEEAQRKNVEPAIGPWCYQSLDEATQGANEQLAIYKAWQDAGIINIVPLADSPTRPFSDSLPSSPLQVAFLLEGAAAVQSPEHFQHFYNAGARVVSLTWNEGSQYSGGDQTVADVTPLGKKLLAELDRLGIIHDVSHLSEKAFWTVLHEATGIKVASHSNCRALLPGRQHPERHLSDDQIKALAKCPHSVIGIVLFTKFLVSAQPPAVAPRAAIADILRHMQHIEQLTGRRDILALGSDMDGGFTRNDLPSDLTLPIHLQRLAGALSSAGWTDDQIHHFAWQNWANVLKHSHLPSPDIAP